MEAQLLDNSKVDNYRKQNNIKQEIKANFPSSGNLLLA